MGAHKKRVPWPPPSVSCLDFVHWMNVNLLTNLATSGSLYTWHHGRFNADNVPLCLDRSLCNEEWLNFWHHRNSCNLFRHQSDHLPLLLFVVASPVRHAMPFKFFKLWTTHEDFHRLVIFLVEESSRCWHGSFTGEIKKIWSKFPSKGTVRCYMTWKVRSAWLHMKLTAYNNWLI